MRRLLFLLLPRDAGVHQHELDEQFEYCVRRERARLGRLGVPYAWARLILDVVMTSLLLRRDAWHQRRINRLGTQVTSGDSIMIRLREDIRYSVRVLLRSPGFSAAVVIALGPAIGATTSVFTVVNAVLLKSLPFRDPSRLVMVFEEIPGAKSSPIAFSAPDFRGFQERARSFDGLAAYVTKTYELSGVDQPERVAALRASAALFDVLGAAPVPGARVHARGGRGRHPGGRAERWIVAAIVRRRSVGHRPRGNDRSPCVYRRRRDAPDVRVPQQRSASQQRAGRPVRARQLWIL